MNIGIIVYSQTGHTLSVAMKLEEKLSAAGHVVNLERVEIYGPDRPGATHVSLKTKPSIDAYDALVFGSPVRGGMMPPAMTSYLEQVTSLQGKRVVCLVTHFFPKNVLVKQSLNTFAGNRSAEIRPTGGAHRWYSSDSPHIGELILHSAIASKCSKCC